MEIPDLPPDLQFVRLGTDPSQIDFAFEAKRAAMRPHIVKRWNWDEAFQRGMHERNYSEKPFFGIHRAKQRLGTVSFQRQADHLRFGEFYLFPEYQGRGVGSAILAHCIALADDMKFPVRLEYLHWNPVGSLYRRHGFEEVGHSETHCILQREPVIQ